MSRCLICCLVLYVSETLDLLDLNVQVLCSSTVIFILQALSLFLHILISAGEEKMPISIPFNLADRVIHYLREGFRLVQCCSLIKGSPNI